MKSQKGPISGLKDFLPEDTFPLVLPFFELYRINLTIKQERKSILGDYRNPTPAHPVHKISVNGNLNPYSFLVTLLHELAHLETFVKYKHTVAAHGKEWKEEFRKILLPFLRKNLFPNDIGQALVNYINNVKATTCGDVTLYKTLSKYNKKSSSNLVFVDELPLGSIFKVPHSGKIFRKENKRRTRHICIEVATNISYLFPGIYEVELISTN